MFLAIAGVAKKLTEGGFILGGLGALVLGYGALSMLRGSHDRERERWSTVVAAVLIAVGFGLQLIGLVTTTPTKTPTQPTSGQVGSPSP